MTFLDKICPDCGASSNEKEFVGLFCVECYAKRARLHLPREIVIRVCKRCGRFGVRRWSEKISDLEDEVRKLVKGKFDSIDVKVDESGKRCLLTIHFGKAKLEKEIKVKLKKSLCDVCQKIARGYYEAIIQLRGEAIEKAGELKRELEAKTFISKEVELKNGIDLYVGSTQAAYEALRNLGLRFRTSKKLWGVKKGKRLFRTTFAVHLS